MPNIFPTHIEFSINENVVNIVNNEINKYKYDTKKAVVWSISQNQNIISESRDSHKTSFNSEKLTKTLNHLIIPQIYNKLAEYNSNGHYNIQIGDQLYDYVKYNNGGYFETHRDFVRINSEQQCQYTMIIGLSHQSYDSKATKTSNGSTLIWLPIDTEELKSHHNIILNEFAKCNKIDNSENNINHTHTEEYLQVISKYNIPSSYTIIDIINLLESHQNYFPYFSNAYEMTKVLLFKSELYHSGEKYFSEQNKSKEILVVTLNITGTENIKESEQIEMFINDSKQKFIVFNKFCPEQIEWCIKYNLLPYQIILNDGMYKYQDFSEKIIRYFNLNREIFKQKQENENCDNYDNYDYSYRLNHLNHSNDFNKIYDHEWNELLNTFESDKTININMMEKINNCLRTIYNDTKNKLASYQSSYDDVYSSITDINSNIKDLILNKSLNKLCFEQFVDSYNGPNKYMYNKNIYDSEQIIAFMHEIQEFVESYTGPNNALIKHNETVETEWEIEMCNDDAGSSGSYTSYLNCNIDIKFCFMKLN